MRRCDYGLRDDRGASAVVVALLLVVFIGFAALVVDMGYAYTVKRQLQAAADAAALAGCQELIIGATESKILDIARLYSEEYNSGAPGEGLSMLRDAPDTEVTSTYVKVTVEKPMSLFFGRVFTKDSGMIRAQAKAQIAYLTGMRGIVPWAVPVLHADRVEATLNGVTTQLTLDGATGTWKGNVPLPSSASGSGYPVRVVAYNGQEAYPDGTVDPAIHPNGVPEAVDPAAAVTVLPVGAPIQDISLSRYYAVAGVHTGVTLTVRAAVRPTARFDGKNFNLAQTSPGVWQVSLPVPAAAGLVTRMPVNIEVGTGANRFSVDSAAVLVVRRSTYPIQEVKLTRYVAQTGSAGSVGVEVMLNDYVYGNEYELKVVGGGAEIGNFMALDLATIKHTPNWRNPQHPSEYAVSGGNVYIDYLEKPFPHVIHLGDTIWTQTGSGTGPQTEKALQDRFAGNSMTFAAWEAAGSPPGNGRIIFVPIMEKVQETTGQTPLRVVSFAAFYIEPGSDLKGSAIKGRFIKYLAPSDDLSDTPPDGLYMMTPRLVSAGIY